MLELIVRSDDAAEALAAIMALGELRGQAMPVSLEAAVDSRDESPRFSAAAGIVTDHLSGLQWSQEDATSDACTWAKADAACKALRIGGHDDWRLPTRAELLTLVDDTQHEPAINREAFPSCKSSWYWTATPWASSPSGCAWLVAFNYGYSGYGLRDHDHRVRAVRGVPRQFLAVLS